MSKDHPDVVCKNCKWYDSRPYLTKDKGICRVNPPLAPVTKKQGSTLCSYFYEYAVWPIVYGEEDWCGSYRIA